MEDTPPPTDPRGRRDRDRSRSPLARRQLHMPGTTAGAGAAVGNGRGGGAGGGDGSAGDDPVQITIRPGRRIEKKRLFINGTFFLDGTQGNVNSWHRFPWEFLFWPRDSHTRAIATEYQFWRANGCKLELTNTGQCYSATAGGQLVAGQNSQAKVYCWFDTDRLLSGDYNPGIDMQTYQDALFSIAHDGFTAAGAVHHWLPQQTFTGLVGPRMTDDDCTQITAQGGSKAFEWNMSHQGWRHTVELVTPVDQCSQVSTLDGQHTVTGFHAGQTEPLFSRLDNWGCSFFCGSQIYGPCYDGPAQQGWYQNNMTATTLDLYEFRHMSDFGGQIGDTWTNVSSFKTDNVRRCAFKKTIFDAGWSAVKSAQRVRAHAEQLWDSLAYMKAQVQDPQPGIYLSMQLQPNQSLTGIQPQKIQIQFKWTIDIEVSGRRCENRKITGAQTLDNRIEVAQDQGYHTFPFFIPFYPSRFQSNNDEDTHPSQTTGQEFREGLRRQIM